MTQEQQQEIRRLRTMGEGYKRIGAILNLSVNTVKSFCRRDIRGRGVYGNKGYPSAVSVPAGRVPGEKDRPHSHKICQQICAQYGNAA